MLPPNYKAGDIFDGLVIAEKIYNRETFTADKPDDLYHFGDPVAQPDGTYKYPELVPYFTSYGESNRDVMMRLCSLIIQTYEKRLKLLKRTKVVVVTHSQLYAILQNMMVVAERVKKGEIRMYTGELSRLCWQVFQERRQKGEKLTYGIKHLSIEDYCDEQTVTFLKNELEYLQNLPENSVS